MKVILIGLVIFAALAIAVMAQGRKGSPGSASGEPAAAGVASGDMTPGEFAARSLRWEELAAIMAEEDSHTYLVDVRTPGEFDSGAIPGAINIPHTEIGTAPPTGDRSARIVVYCRSGNRSASAKFALEQLGYTNVNDFGGVYRWEGELVRR